MKQKIGFLFDNDGVLIDSSAFHWKAWQLLMKEDPLLKMDHESFIKGFGKRNDLILQETAPEVPLEIRQRWEKRKEELFRECARENIKLLDGMEDFLKQVREANIPRIIASSTPTENLKMFLSYTVLGNYFDQYISAEEVAHGKPYPDIFLAAAQRLKVEPRAAIVFEDSPAGVEAGKRAGCFVVALETTHKREELMAADLIVPSAHFLSIEEILDHWQKK